MDKGLELRTIAAASLSAVHQIGFAREYAVQPFYLPEVHNRGGPSNLMNGCVLLVHPSGNHISEMSLVGI